MKFYTLFSPQKAALRESWLDDMMHVLEEEDLGPDAATVEAALKRHEAISTDVKARVRRTAVPSCSLGMYSGTPVCYTQLNMAENQSDSMLYYPKYESHIISSMKREH